MKDVAPPAEDCGGAAVVLNAEQRDFFGAIDRVMHKRGLTVRVVQVGDRWDLFARHPYGHEVGISVELLAHGYCRAFDSGGSPLHGYDVAQRLLNRLRALATPF